MDLAELHLPRSVAYVGLARLVVASAARLAGLPEERLEDLKIAVSEAATHAVKAGDSSQDGTLVLAFGAHRGAFEVHLLGGGVGAEATRGALDEWPDENGLGRTLMEGLADEVVFPEASGSQLVLRFVLAEVGTPVRSAADTVAGGR